LSVPGIARLRGGDGTLAERLCPGTWRSGARAEAASPADARELRTEAIWPARSRAACTTRDRYTIRGYLSTAVKHGRNALTVLRDVLLGQPWMPELPAPT